MILDKIALLLTVIGGINWGLIGLFRFDLVAWIFGGQGAIFSRIDVASFTKILNILQSHHLYKVFERGSGETLAKSFPRDMF